jgi:hypothetical protein
MYMYLFIYINIYVFIHFIFSVYRYTLNYFCIYLGVPAEDSAKQSLIMGKVGIYMIVCIETWVLYICVCIYICLYIYVSLP